MSVLMAGELNVIRRDRKDGQNRQNKTHVMRKWYFVTWVEGRV